MNSVRMSDNMKLDSLTRCSYRNSSIVRLFNTSTSRSPFASSMQCMLKCCLYNQYILFWKLLAEFHPISVFHVSGVGSSKILDQTLQVFDGSLVQWEVQSDHTCRRALDSDTMSLCH